MKDEDHLEIVAETFHKLDGLPIMICVLERANEYFSCGISCAKRRKYDDDLAKRIARRNAYNNAEHHARPR